VDDERSPSRYQYEGRNVELKNSLNEKLKGIINRYFKVSYQGSKVIPPLQKFKKSDTNHGIDYRNGGNRRVVDDEAGNIELKRDHNEKLEKIINRYFKINNEDGKVVSPLQQCKNSDRNYNIDYRNGGSHTEVSDKARNSELKKAHNEKLKEIINRYFKISNEDGKVVSPLQQCENSDRNYISDYRNSGSRTEVSDKAGNSELKRDHIEKLKEIIKRYFKISYEDGKVVSPLQKCKNSDINHDNNDHVIRSREGDGNDCTDKSGYNEGMDERDGEGKSSQWYVKRWLCRFLLLYEQ